MSVAEGVDYSYTRPDPVALRKAGKTFAVRYVGTQGSGKNLTKPEADRLKAAGLDLVANYEGRAAGWMQGGRQVGIDAAKAAYADAVACGMPPDRPIYFSADYNATFDQYKTQIRPCLQGAASVIGVDRVGIYGGLEQVDWAYGDGIVKWVWQTYAWSYGVWSKHGNLQQYRNGVSLAGGTVDLDRAVTADFGQWAATGEDLSIVDAETKAYLDKQFADLDTQFTTTRQKVQDSTVLLLRGDSTEPDTHPDNLQSIHGDTQKLLAGGITVSLSLADATPQQIQDLGNAIANGLVVKGVGYSGTVDLSPKPVS